MVRLPTWSAWLSAGVLAIAAPLSAQSANPPSAARDSALAVARAFIAADSRKDAEAVMALFAPDPDVTIVSNGVARPSREDFRKALVSLYGSIQTLTIVEDSAVVSVMGSEAAVVTALYRFTQVDAAGHSSTGRAAITYACQRRQGAWRIVHYHFSRAGS
jgi:uncharacterized protein (TIGR02246 family)